MKRIKQFRYYADGNSKNSPGGTYAGWVQGNIFSNYFPITQLGIQSLPGTRFYLNNSADPIIIGHTGIYELDLDGDTQITALQFAGESMVAVKNNDNSYVIVDIIYEAEEAES